MYQWARRDPNGYEVSSKGDKRFSAFYAKLGDGKSIEYHYQVTIKGYPSIVDGKGKDPRIKISREDLWLAYKLLWQIYFNMHPELLVEISVLAKDKVLTDLFATSDINQARAICELLNEMIEPLTELNEINKKVEEIRERL